MSDIDLSKVIVREYPKEGIELGIIYCVECEAVVVEIITWVGVLKCKRCKRCWCVLNEDKLRICEDCDDYVCLECEPESSQEKYFSCETCSQSKK